MNTSLATSSMAQFPSPRPQRLMSGNCLVNGDSTAVPAGNTSRLKRTFGRVLLGLAIAASLFVSVGTADAHRAPCHTQHTCPSDHHTYLWRGLSCTANASERTARDTTVVHYAGRRYFCRKGK
jgi:hypothetical protein